MNDVARAYQPLQTNRKNLREYFETLRDYLDNPTTFVDDVLNSENAVAMVTGVLSTLKRVRWKPCTPDPLKHLVSTAWSQIYSLTVNARNQAIGNYMVRKFLKIIWQEDMPA